MNLPVPLAFAFRSIGPALNALALIVLVVFTLVAIGLLVYLAALPGRVATRRGHPLADAVRIAGWLGLPTGVGWVAAMVWAFCSTDADSRATSIVSGPLASLEAAVDELEQRTQGGRP